MTIGCGKNLPLLFAALIAGALLASGVSASAEGFKRTMLRTTAFPGTQYTTALYIVDIDAGASVPKQTHPGLETLYVLEGESGLAIEGQPGRHLKPGDSAQIAIGTVHTVTAGAKPVKLLITYVVEKDKPLATNVPAK